MSTIQFSKTLFGEIVAIDVEQYEQLCRHTKNIFERIPDDEPVKLYFDADHVFTEEFEFYNIETANCILDLHKGYITSFFEEKCGITPVFAVAESHSKRRMKGGVEVWGYSFHIVIQNIIAFKHIQKNTIEHINKYIVNGEKLKDSHYDTCRYEDYLFEHTENFIDTSVYGAGFQRIRAVYASKDKEDRPFNIIEGTFNEMVISAFIDENATLYDYVIEKKMIPPPVPFEGIPDQNKDITLFKAWCDAGIFTKRAKSYETWHSILRILKNEFQEGGREPFHYFSKLSNKYNSLDVNEAWDAYENRRETPAKFASICDFARKENPQLNKEVRAKLKAEAVIESNINDDTLLNTSDKNDEYADWKSKFELVHCKIINKSFFIKQNENMEDFTIFNKNALITSYEHLSCYVSNGKIKGLTKCVIEWISDSSMRVYDDVGIYPGLTCPANMFNMWCPFAMENIVKWEKRTDAVTTILNHIKILCGNNDVVFDYFIKWIAQMIQYPSIKSICPTLISKQGAGKGTLMKLLERMMGSSKVFETSSPSRDVFGDFNGRMANSFLVNLNELSKKETLGSEGRMKTLITDPKLTINMKGVNQYDIQSYHRFIITTNNPEPINTTGDDRRNLIVRSSDEKIGNKDYFVGLHNLLENTDVIKSCYEHFKGILDMDKFGLLPIPQTEYHNNLKNLSITPIELWLMDYVIDNESIDVVQMLASEAYVLFRVWVELKNMEYVMSSQKFGVRLALLQINGIRKVEHTNKGNQYEYNISKIKAHFKM